MIPVTLLDLIPIREGGTPAEAYLEAARLAHAAEEAGYHRYWVAEHHGMEGIGGAATSVVLAHVGHATSSIRIGAGGIMLPNHNPFVIAEQFGTLEALFPGRIDLGLGRAPGADGRIAQALRKDLMRAAESFPDDVVELMARFSGDPRLPLATTPGHGANVEMWILGSSLFGAQLAAHLGLPYAFASHFAPTHLDDALRVYRERFQPSDRLDRPHVAAAMTVIAADSDEEANYLASSLEQQFVSLRHGTPGKLQPPVRGYRESLSPHDAATLRFIRTASAIGSPASIRESVRAFMERTGADELVFAGSIHDPEARIRSARLAMEAVSELEPVGEPG
ncbi:alkane 1-monooxygenase [Novosphingobium marinum]|uniref:Luciferase-like monooxygenase n=1 Tax=Novosphingobium marinum TaxID=1514948 RepID=A0A7Z0BVU5_9SPHN|nr:LLM class flavin-dependent oxidoreductase [Novosphingobium marinum]NYH95542.1 luciferase family oxidoreductase group 1 [Novosphingobium marinum]GGC27884.1 alkane 1-monooxygenase [Novosphingobium marinum]